MAKTDKYIITEPTASAKEKGSRALTLDDTIIKGSFWVHFGWFMKPPARDTDALTTHSHDFDEVIGFAGSNKNNPRDLGGEIEFWMGGEKHVLTKTCLIFIPKGVTHCPVVLKRIDTPIFMFEAGNNTVYEKIK